MNLMGFKGLAGILAVTVLASHCGQPPDKATALRSIEKSAAQDAGSDPSAEGGTNPDGSPAVPAPAGTDPVVLSKSLEFFNNNVLAVFKGAPCSDCHNAPRNLKDINVNGGTGVQVHNTMFALLKNGKGANDNALINKLLNIVPHKGGKVCATEAAVPCAKVKEWYRLVFGDGALALGKIENINREGQITGWAGSSEVTTTSYEVKLYLDGPKGTGTALPPVMANLDGFDNSIAGAHSFSVKLPDANIDGKAHTIHAYTTHNGQEIELAGSPFSYQAFKPKTAAVATAFNQVNLNGCNGACHAFAYADRWSVMLGNGSDLTWSATSNSFYDKVSGKVGHGGPALPGAVNLNAVQMWWTQEFGP